MNNQTKNTIDDLRQHFGAALEANYPGTTANKQFLDHCMMFATQTKQELLDLLKSEAVYAKVKSGNGELEYVIPLTALKELGDAEVKLCNKCNGKLKKQGEIYVCVDNGHMHPDNNFSYTCSFEWCKCQQ
jgi:uncharacterized protein with PIN domain